MADLDEMDELLSSMADESGSESEAEAAAPKKRSRKPKASKAPEDEKPQDETDAPETEAPAKTVIAPGRAIISRSRGMLVSPAEVTAQDFVQGEERIEQLITAGYLVRQ